MNELKTDILIVGGGLTGLALMLAVKTSPFRCMLVDQKGFDTEQTVDFDARSLALSPSSRRIFQSLNLWADIEPFACPIKHIHVSEQGGFARTRLQAKPNMALGHLVEMADLQRVLVNKTTKEHILAPAECLELDTDQHVATLQYQQQPLKVRYQILVAADGSESRIRQLLDLPVERRLFGQKAVVANIGLHRSHMNQAFERFTKHGPIALLPQKGDKMGLVFAMQNQQADTYMAMSDDTFLQALQQQFGGRLGLFRHLGKRSCWPLMQSYMPKQVAGQVVFIGNAAHTLHPVAGQGFNLALRDVSALAQCIFTAGLSTEALVQYVSMRQFDHKSIVKLTSGLIDVFSSQIPGAALIRQTGLLALDNSTTLKQLLSWYAGGFPGPISDLICDIALEES